MKIDQDDVTALFGTIIIHLIALFLLYISVLRTFVPVDDGSIPVVFGDLYATVGAAYQPPAATIQPPRVNPPQTPIRPEPPQNKQLITQDKVETVQVPETKKVDETSVANEAAQREREAAEKQRREAEERQRREAEERRRREEEQRKQQEAISNRVSNAFGPGSAQDDLASESTARATNQGSPFGNTDTGMREGTGGFGSFNLSGRSIGSGGLPRPAYTEREEGKIVIRILVDPNGNVIQADIDRGTNIANITMRNSALDAAKRAKFNKIQSTNNQSGTITYNYKYL